MERASMCKREGMAPAVTALDLQALVTRLIDQVKRAAKALPVRPCRPLPSLLPSSSIGSPSRLSLVLTDVSCKERTTDRAGARGGVILIGVAFAEGLSPYVIGPFEMASFSGAGEVQRFEPPGLLVTLPLAPAIPQNAVAFTVAMDFNGVEVPGRIAAVLDLTTRLLQREARRLAGPITLEEGLAVVARVFAQTSSIVGLSTPGEHVLVPDTTQIHLQPSGLFGNARRVSSASRLIWQNTGVSHFVDYRSQVLWVAH